MNNETRLTFGDHCKLVASLGTIGLVIWQVVHLFLAVAVVTVALGACDGTAMSVPDAGADTKGDVETADRGPCCVHYAAGSQVVGCWRCGDVLRCSGTSCATGSATLPLCQAQPVEPYTLDSPSCD